MDKSDHDDLPTHSFQKEYYDKKYEAHKEWSKFRLLKREKRLQWIFPYIKSTDKLLDIGCGLGYMAHRMSAKCEHATGVDISENGIALANQKFGSSRCNFINKDILDFDESDKLDVVVMVELIEHLEDPKSILLKIHKLLDDENGRLIITTPRGDRLTNRIRTMLGLNPRRDIYHVHEYTRSEMVDLLKSAGFDCTVTKYSGLDLPFPARYSWSSKLKEIVCENAFGWSAGATLPFFCNSVFYLAKKA